MWNEKDYNGKRICVAVSGGVDSVALLHYLHSKRSDGGYRLFAVHCEHGIRGEESVGDMRFVESLCLAWEIPLYIFKEDCPARAIEEKCSLETAARHFRYESFAKLIEEDKVDYIATAHHKNDDAETVLFRLARGTSLSGVRGIAKAQGYLLRPFLSKSKAEILSYAKANGLEHREDYTNFQTDATRNKLRLEILPALENAVPGASENLARFARLAEEDDTLLYELSKSLLQEREEGYEVKFSDKKPLFTRACLSALKLLGMDKDYTALHLESVFALQQSERGAKLNLPQGVVAEKTVEGVFLSNKQEEILPPIKRSVLFTEMQFDGGRYAVKVAKTPEYPEGEGWRTLKIDGDKLPENAYFRFREDGDRIEKFGGGTKTLKKFFNEKKIPVKERAHLPLIAGEDGTVYAVCGVEISEKVKVDEDTKNTLYVCMKKQ